MALTLIVEDGTGVSGANVYDTAESAASWLVDYGFTAFNAAGTDLRKRYLIEATRFLEQVVETHLTGERADFGISAQRLHFPRYGAIDWQGALIEADTVPIDYRHAIFLAAEKLAAGVMLSAFDSRSSIGSESDDGASVVYRRERDFSELHSDIWSRARPAFSASIRGRRA